MKKLINLLVLIILTISLIGCGDSLVTEQVESGATEIVVETTKTEEVATEVEEVQQTVSETVVNTSNEIVLNNSSITITEAGTYYISGSIDNGQIIVDSADKDDVELVLENVTINSNDSAAIYVKDSGDVIVTLIGDSNLSVNADISDNVDSVDGVIYSKSDLIFDGSGSLTISSDYVHGIVGKDDVEFESGNINITVAKDGIQANDSVSVVDTNLAISASKDGIQVDNDENTDKGYVYLENSNMTIISGEDAINASNYVYAVSGQYTIKSGEDGIQADLYVDVTGGTFNITTGGGYQGVLNDITVGEGSSGVVSETDQLTESMKAVKSDDITVDQGTFVISSFEDGFNANNDITINGGVFTINSGDEAFTAKNSLVINDGTINIENGYEGLEAVYITINGGDITINVLDDGINGGESYSLVTIAGGNLTVACQGDGLDSNGDMVISGGNIVLDVSAIYVGGDGNVDVTGTLTYTGGTIVDASGNTIDPTEQLMGGGMQPGGGGPKRP